MSVPFHPDAQQEMRAALDRYERIDPVLAAELTDALLKAEADIETAPLRNALAGDAPPDMNIRELLIRRFRLRVIYLVDSVGPSVVAVAHARRRPGYWRYRLFP
jgi:hypothetical protein